MFKKKSGWKMVFSEFNLTFFNLKLIKMAIRWLGGVGGCGRSVVVGVSSLGPVAPPSGLSDGLFRGPENPVVTGLNYRHTDKHASRVEASIRRSG